MTRFSRLLPLIAVSSAWITAPALAQGAAAAPPARQVVGRSTAKLSPGIRVGHLLFVSGQLGTGDSTMQGQTKRALDNIKAVLDQAGAKVEDVAKCTVFLASLDDSSGMNQARATEASRKRTGKVTSFLRRYIVSILPNRRGQDSFLSPTFGYAP